MGKRRLSPMTPAEWIDMIDLVTSPQSGLWPGQSKAWTTAESKFGLFENYPTEVIRSAIHALFDEGLQNAPSLSKLRAKAKEIASARFGEYTLDDLEPCTHLNTGAMFDINTNRVVVFCSRGADCGWEEQTTFESMDDYHAHYDRLEAQATAAKTEATVY